MTDPTTTSEAFEDRVFLWLVLGVSLAFIWILRPYAGAILWGTVLAIVFAPSTGTSATACASAEASPRP